MAAAAVTSLNVEPGGRVVPMARLISGLPGSFSSLAASEPTAPKSCAASALGSKVGLETIASTLPVLGSSATTAPWTSSPRARSPSKAAVCAAASMLS